MAPHRAYRWPLLVLLPTLLWHAQAQQDFFPSSFSNNENIFNRNPGDPNSAMRPFRHQYPFQEPSHLIIASRKVRPGQIYRVHVQILSTDVPISVRASVRRDGVELAYAQHRFEADTSDTLLMEIPPNAIVGQYMLRVEGNRDRAVIGGSLFLNQTALEFDSRSNTILIQTNKPIYQQNEEVRFRAIPLGHDLTPFKADVDVFVLDPDGYIMRRWLSRQSNLGAVSLSYALSDNPKGGKWIIRVRAQAQVEEQDFLVEEYHQPRFEVNVTMPPFFLTGGYAITGYVEANYTWGEPVFGNMSLRAYVRPAFGGRAAATQPTNYASRVMKFFNGFTDFIFTLAELESLMGGGRGTLDGAEVTVEATVNEPIMSMTASGYSIAKIYNSTVKLQFLGAQPQALTPGMPFVAYVAASSQDGAPLDQYYNRFVTVSGTITDRNSGQRPIRLGRRPSWRDSIDIRNIFGERSRIGTNAYDSEERRAAFADPYMTPNRGGNERYDRYDGGLYNSSYGVDRYGGFDRRNLPYGTAYRTTYGLTDRANYSLPASGILRIEFDTPIDAQIIQLEASYTDNSNIFTREVVKASLRVLRRHSDLDRHLFVWTSTRSIRVSEFCVFHVRANYAVTKFNWLIVSKGMILLSGREEIRSGVGTFAIAVSAEMAPQSHMIVYSVHSSGQVVANSLTIPVNGISRNKFRVFFNDQKDLTRKTVEIAVYGEPGSYVGMGAVDENLFRMQYGNDLTHANVLARMNAQERSGSVDEALSHRWTSRVGDVDRRVYFPAESSAPDVNRTFDHVGLVVFTDANVTRLWNACNRTLGQYECMSGSRCYAESQLCDGFIDCPDGTDESRCPDRGLLSAQNLTDFRVMRVSRLMRLYENNWLWRDVNIGPEGHFIFKAQVPERPALYVLTAVSVSWNNGFGLLDEPQRFHSARPFYSTMEVPEKMRSGEQLGIRIALFNFNAFEIEVLVSLEASNQYRFVHVEGMGVVQAYGPRTSGGEEHQHLVWLSPYDTQIVYMPVVPIVQRGSFTVRARVSTGIGEDHHERSIEVEPDGVPQRLHTSTLLDLSNRAVVIKYLDINTTETNIIPRQRERLYVSGSPRVSVSLVGDIYGPAFAEMPMNSWNMLRKPFSCGEQAAFNFAANVYTLRYLRLTNQMTSKVARAAFRYVNIDYQMLAVYQTWNGAFREFYYDGPPSVWTTAFMVNALHRAQVLIKNADWENHFYVDPAMLDRAVEWLISRQGVDGSFREEYNFPHDRKMSFHSMQPDGIKRYRNITLTAHALIALTENADLGGSVGSGAASARWKAAQYLERQISGIWDPYEVSIVTYALTRHNSPAKEQGFEKLDTLKRVLDGNIYWGRVDVPPNNVTIRNNKPYLEPRLPYIYDSMSIETTAYAMMVYQLRGSFQTVQIAQWLNGMRLHDAGFSSTQDTIVALQALAEYSVWSRLRDVTDMEVTIEVSSVPNFTPVLRVTRDNLSQLQRIEIPNAWGEIRAVARGAGMAILQLDVDYTVDYVPYMLPPPVRAFDLQALASYRGFNSSVVHYRICASWVRTDESPRSGLAIIEADMPSGYVVYQPSLYAYLDENLGGRIPFLRLAEFQYNKAFFYFDHLAADPTCIEFNAERWYPVANMTRYLSVRVYDYYAPERHNSSIFDAFNLYVLSICQVCGSYQCPYCPHVFSGASPTATSALALISTLAILLAGHRSRLP